MLGVLMFFSLFTLMATRGSNSPMYQVFYGRCACMCAVDLMQWQWPSHYMRAYNKATYAMIMINQLNIHQKFV